VPLRAGGEGFLHLCRTSLPISNESALEAAPATVPRSHPARSGPLQPSRPTRSVLLCRPQSIK